MYKIMYILLKIMNVEYTELYTLFEILRMLIVLNYVILGKNVYVEYSKMSTVF